MHLRQLLKFSSLVAAAILLSMTTFIAGALPMRAVRIAYGRLPFWAGFALASAALAVAGLPAGVAAVYKRYGDALK